MREIPEWVADHPDQAIPQRVKLRIWEREGGRCYLSGLKIQPGDKFEYEHVIALACGGCHRESNIKLALSAPHKAKTARDVATKAKIARQKAKHIGIAQPKAGGFRGWRKMNGEIVWRDRT